MFRRLLLGETTQEARKQHKRSGSIYPEQQSSPPSFPGSTTRHQPRMLRHQHPHAHAQHHRRTEDVDYWRKRAGWFDDDAAMKDYNDGVYDTYYQLDDDQQRAKGGGAGRIANSDLASHAIKALSVLVALCLCILIFRVISRRLGDSKDKKKKRSSSSVARSKSRSRSRSRSRKGREGDYEIMDDKDGENKSHRSRSSRRSSRSKSRSRRSRSRSHSRARSSSKSRKEPSPVTPVEPILV